MHLSEIVMMRPNLTAFMTLIKKRACFYEFSQLMVDMRVKTNFVLKEVSKDLKRLFFFFCQDLGRDYENISEALIVPESIVTSIVIK